MPPHPLPSRWKSIYLSFNEFPFLTPGLYLFCMWSSVPNKLLRWCLSDSFSSQPFWSNTVDSSEKSLWFRLWIGADEMNVTRLPVIKVSWRKDIYHLRSQKSRHLWILFQHQLKNKSTVFDQFLSESCQWSN